MKIKRQKKVTRILAFFQRHFCHRTPYRVLIDGTFCRACLDMKVNIRDQLPKYLTGGSGEPPSAKLLTTRCCLLEMEKLSKMDPGLYGAAVILKQFGMHECGHSDAKPAVKCLKSMLGSSNAERYFIASQDDEMRARARKIAGTPIIYLHQSAPTLEKPSGMSEETANKEDTERMSFQSKTIERLKLEAFGEPIVKAKKKRKVKGPNPLSCLKKKPKDKASVAYKKVEIVKEQVTNEKKKRKRIRKRRNGNSENNSLKEVVENK